MSEFENERDPGTLRQIARLLLHENERLHKRLEELVAENANLKGHTAPEQLTLELSSLQEQMARLQKQLYGVSSERRPKAGTTSDEPARIRRGHGPTPQQRLPIEPVVVTIAPEECVCDHCGGSLKAIEGATEDSERVTVVERKFVVQQIQRQKYRCDCGIGLCTAPAPLTHLPGGRYSPEFAIQVAVDKYLQHLPLDRQRRAMERQGLVITTQTLWDQLEALATVWTPACERLRHYILGDDVMGVDETWWWMMDKKPTKKWWVWSLTCPSAVWYRIAPQRSAKLAASLIEGYTGTLVCDAYRVYETLAKQNKNLRLALCWAHARRYFVEAERNYPQCEVAITLIGKLFEIERDTDDPALFHGDAKLAAAEARLRARTERAPPILQTLREWAEKQHGLPKSGIRRAVDYMLGHWKSLTVFLEDPFVPLDNNRTERALRGVVVGRKNHYGSRSQRGTEVAALFYSILETAALNGLDPAAYLRTATYALLEGAAPQSVLPIASR